MNQQQYAFEASSIPAKVVSLIKRQGKADVNTERATYNAERRYHRYHAVGCACVTVC